MAETATKYRVLRGCNFPPDNTRANEGDVIELDKGTAARLLDLGAVEKLTAKEAKALEGAK